MGIFTINNARETGWANRSVKRHFHERRSQWPRRQRRRSTAARLLAIVGSNPTGGTDVCLLWVLCVVG
jgi:hypothetical protein